MAKKIESFPTGHTKTLSRFLSYAEVSKNTYDTRAYLLMLLSLHGSNMEEIGKCGECLECLYVIQKPINVIKMVKEYLTYLNKHIVIILIYNCFGYYNTNNFHCNFRNKEVMYEVIRSPECMA